MSYDIYTMTDNMQCTLTRREQYIFKIFEMVRWFSD
jgi:hypothetical protein